MMRHWFLVSFIGLIAPLTLANSIQPTLGDFGGAGLLQTPTARMFDAGEFAVYRNHTFPYTWQGFMLQPLYWFEGNVRYIDIQNREYDPREKFSTISRKDKAIDFKLLLNKESYYMPQVSLGWIDGGGTGLFSSEFLVGNKRFGDFDLSLGLGWGYLGTRGDIDNPLALILGDTFNHRAPPKTTGLTGGNFSANKYFKGAPSVFGGVEYQTKWNPLVLKFEVEGNNYREEPLLNDQKQNSRVNVGAVFHINKSLDANIGFERGNSLMFGLTIHANTAKMKPLPKPFDQEPEAIKTPVKKTAELVTDWNEVSNRLEVNAGYRVKEIALRNHEIVMTGSQAKFFSHPKGLGRAARILNNTAGTDVEWLTVIDEVAGMRVKETNINREVFQAVASFDENLETLHRTIVETDVYNNAQNVVYKNEEKPPYQILLGMSYRQIIGSPDAFVQYRVSADVKGYYFFAPNFWWTGTLSRALIDNDELFKFDGPSKLPRVRTDLRKYLITSELQMPVFQINYAKQLSQNFYSLTYAGMFEYMYGGVGGEILYRPFGESWAVGLDINKIKQRAYEQDFDFKQYTNHAQITGHLTAYWKPNFNNVLDEQSRNMLQGMFFTVSAGKYLAKDNGVTLGAARVFNSGATMGAFATFTNVSQKQFGEGSFDKGIYFSIPWDLMISSSIQSSATFLWRPLTRDGGAKLGKSFSLYGMTGARDLNVYKDGFGRVLE